MNDDNSLRVLADGPSTHAVPGKALSGGRDAALGHGGHGQMGQLAAQQAQPEQQPNSYYLVVSSSEVSQWY